MRANLPTIRLDGKPADSSSADEIYQDLLDRIKRRPANPGCPESARQRFDPSIRSAAKADGEIEILGEIGESFWTSNFTTAKMVKDQLKAIGKAPVLATINSPGGDAFEGIAIYNLFRDHPAPVTVKVIGIAASAASIIAMAGDPVNMGQAAMLMIHSASSLMAGNQYDMRAFADILQSIDDSVAGLYAARTGMPKDKILDMMKTETWLSADQAVKDGFADKALADKAKPKASMEQRVVFLHPPVQKPVVLKRPGVVYL